MPLTVVETGDERLVAAAVLVELRAGLCAQGSVVLLVPSFAQALEAQRILAHSDGLALSVTVTTPRAWVAQQWELWGDGRQIASTGVLSALAYRTVRGASSELRGPIVPSQGVTRILSQLVRTAYPWLPLDEHGFPHADACDAAELTHAERCLLALAGSMGARLSAHGYVCEAQAALEVPALMGAAGAVMPPVVVAGFDQMARRERELLCLLAAQAPVSVVVRTSSHPAHEQARALVAWLVEAGATVRQGASGQPVVRHPQLQALLEALFSGEPAQQAPAETVSLALAAGPLAEAELVAQQVEELCQGLDECSSVVVAVPQMERARRTLIPKLTARGLRVRVQDACPLLDAPSAQAFFAFARMVAKLAELRDGWPSPVATPEGDVQRLGDMSWWPPRELTDFLLSDIAHMDTARAWRLDALWRGNRLLSPARVLEMLQSEREVSRPVAHATTELLRGRLGTAASRLLEPFVLASNGDANEAGKSVEAISVLQSILQLAGTLRELGMTADPGQKGSLSLVELIDLCTWMADGVQLALRDQAIGLGEGPLVQVLDREAASCLGPGSADAVVICGLTTVEQPVRAEEDLVSALLTQLGIEPPANPMACERARFAALVSVPRVQLVLERALHDADSKPTYPSVMLSELLEACDMGGDGEVLAVSQRSETDVARNLLLDGRKSKHATIDRPAPAGRLTPTAQPLVFVPQEGSLQLLDGKPVLSASQVETYLDCPYKWFSLRRLRLGTVDAGHTAMEMGTFAHRVLEVTHRQLLVRALEREMPGAMPEELLAAIEADPARQVHGSRVSEDTLEEAQTLLCQEFDLHRQHLHMVRRPRLAQQLLVAHNAVEQEQEEQLRDDLLSSLEFQAGILEGFEPRLFEWSFGRHEDLVEYAGAYFTGTVDRMDVNAHGQAVIIDYKHKSPQGFAAEYDALQEGVLEGERLPNRVQSLIYAQVVRRAFAGRLELVGTTYLSTKSPHALAGAATANLADRIFGTLSSRRLPRVSVPPAPDGSSGMHDLLDRVEELVAQQVKEMLRGNVEASPRDRHSCDFCPVMQCERRVAR